MAKHKDAKDSTLVRVAKLEQNDVFHQLKLVIMAPLTIYLLRSLVSHHAFGDVSESQTSDLAQPAYKRDAPTSMHASKYDANNNSLMGDIVTFAARDMGNVMTLKAPFPATALQLHYIAALVLVVGVMTLKITAPFMLRRITHHPASRDSRVEPSTVTPRSQRQQRGSEAQSPRLTTGQLRFLHRNTGRVVTMAMTGMTLGGLLMTPYPVYSYFTVFNAAVATPWLIWAAGIFLSARMRRWRLHWLLANMAVKGCIGVPLARVLTAAFQREDWQRWTATNVGVLSVGPCPLPLSEQCGYYTGIATSVAIMLPWQLYDVYRFIFCS